MLEGDDRLTIITALRIAIAEVVPTLPVFGGQPQGFVVGRDRGLKLAVLLRQIARQSGQLGVPGVIGDKRGSFIHLAQPGERGCQIVTRRAVIGHSDQLAAQVLYGQILLAQAQG